MLHSLSLTKGRGTPPMLPPHLPAVVRASNAHGIAMAAYICLQLAMPAL